MIGNTYKLNTSICFYYMFHWLCTPYLSYSLVPYFSLSHQFFFLIHIHRSPLYLFHLNTYAPPSASTISPPPNNPHSLSPWWRVPKGTRYAGVSSISLTEGFRFLRPSQGLTNRRRRVFCSRKRGRKAEEKGRKENTQKKENKKYSWYLFLRNISAKRRETSRSARDCIYLLTSYLAIAKWKSKWCRCYMYCFPVLQVGALFRWGD